MKSSCQTRRVYIDMGLKPFQRQPHGPATAKRGTELQDLEWIVQCQCMGVPAVAFFTPRRI